MSTPMQLTVKKQVAPILKRYGVVSASLFGSCARDDATLKSDIDILVTYGPNTSLFAVMDLQTELESTTGRKVDLVSAKYLKPHLAARIAPDRVRIF